MRERDRGEEGRRERGREERRGGGRGLKEKKEKGRGEQKEDGLGERALLLPTTPGLQGSIPCRPGSFLLWECYQDIKGI